MKKLILISAFLFACEAQETKHNFIGQVKTEQILKGSIPVNVVYIEANGSLSFKEGQELDWISGGQEVFTVKVTKCLSDKNKTYIYADAPTFFEPKATNIFYY